ncbi:MAG: peroxide synthase, partial [Nocardiaceae bacterium]|nr:peroxide synthase [Nocardiaceae bacterium]
IGLFNTAQALLPFEEMSIKQGRDVELATYNDYRENCGFPRVTSVEQISSDPAIQEALRKTYASVDNIEFYPGLFAEDRKINSALPPLIGRMVALDAFSQALTNPLLAPRVYHAKTFSELGWKIIEDTNTLSDILNRNVKPGDNFYVSMTRKDWKRGT